MIHAFGGRVCDPNPLPRFRTLLASTAPLRIVAIACGRFEDGGKMRFILR